MKIKKVLVIGLAVCMLAIISWIKYNEGGSVPYPINTGSFHSIGSASVNPTMLLEDARNGRSLLLKNIKSDFPEDMTWIMTIGWSQNDYLEIAEALHKVIWTDNPSEWHLYKASFYSGCENSNGKFENADLYYYHEVKVNGKRKYSVRNILIKPEYGYIAWGGDSIFPRPILGWAEIKKEGISSIPAEKALEMANQQGGSEFRDRQNNECGITVNMWPWGYDRNAWKVEYSGLSNFSNLEIWIPSK